MTILTAPGANTKLGGNVVSWSRPVPDTCPRDCPFLCGRLPNGSLLPVEGLCYADRLRRAVPEVAAAWRRNHLYAYQQWGWLLRDELSAAGAAGHAVRIHVGGDFLRPAMPAERLGISDLREDGNIDWAYLWVVVSAFRLAIPCPPAWVYTHAWRDLGVRGRHLLEAVGIQVFASVHGEAQADEALRLGYRLAIDGGFMPDGGGPAWVGPGRLACPEQRLGFDRITCSTCRYCFDGRRRGDVVFFRHAPGLPGYRPGGRHVER